MSTRVDVTVGGDVGVGAVSAVVPLGFEIGGALVGTSATDGVGGAKTDPPFAGLGRGIGGIFGDAPALVAGVVSTAVLAPGGEISSGSWASALPMWTPERITAAMLNAAFMSSSKIRNEATF